MHVHLHVQQPSSVSCINRYYDCVDAWWRLPSCNGTSRWNFFHREYEKHSAEVHQTHISPSQFDFFFLLSSAKAWLFDIEQYFSLFNSSYKLKFLFFFSPSLLSFAEKPLFNRENANNVTSSCCKEKRNIGKCAMKCSVKATLKLYIFAGIEEPLVKVQIIDGVIWEWVSFRYMEASAHLASWFSTGKQVEEFKPACRPPRFIGDARWKNSLRVKNTYRTSFPWRCARLIVGVGFTRRRWWCRDNRPLSYQLIDGIEPD